MPCASPHSSWNSSTHAAIMYSVSARIAPRIAPRTDLLPYILCPGLIWARGAHFNALYSHPHAQILTTAQPLNPASNCYYTPSEHSLRSSRPLLLQHVCASVWIALRMPIPCPVRVLLQTWISAPVTAKYTSMISAAVLAVPCQRTTIIITTIITTIFIIF